MASDSSWRPTHASLHTLQSGRQLWVLFLHLQLRPCCFRVGQRVDNLALCPRELGRAFEILERVGDLALLEKELGHRCDCNVAFGVD